MLLVGNENSSALNTSSNSVLTPPSKSLNAKYSLYVYEICAEVELSMSSCWIMLHSPDTEVEIRSRDR